MLIDREFAAYYIHYSTSTALNTLSNAMPKYVIQCKNSYEWVKTHHFLDGYLSQVQWRFISGRRKINRFILHGVSGVTRSSWLFGGTLFLLVSKKYFIDLPVYFPM